MTAHPIQVPLSLPLGDVRGNKTVHLLMPKTRGECVGAQRPCQHVGCKFHLVGGIATLPEVAAVNAMAARIEAGCTETCALDVADQGEHSAPYIATLMGVSKQRVQQICDEAGHYARRFGIKEQSDVRSLLETAEVMRDR
jgi:hypothetical protein